MTTSNSFSLSPANPSSAMLPALRVSTQAQYRPGGTGGDEGRDTGPDVVLGVGGRQLDPDAGLAPGDDWEGERDDVDAVAEHVVGDHRRLTGTVVAGEHHRGDGV